MNTTHHILTRNKIAAGHPLFKRVMSLAAKTSEPFWLCVSLALFLLMGPFSIIAVLYGLWSLANEENRQKMIEPASC